MIGKKTIVVTGGNKGIGYAILEQLLKQNSTFEFIMATRSSSNGENALQNLCKSVPDADKRVKIELLDVSNPQSIDQFVSNISKGVGKIDALINNAGMAYKGDEFNIDVVKNTFQTNFYGTVLLTEKMLEFINDEGKIIIVGSSAGKFRILNSNKLKEVFEKPNLSREELFGLAANFHNSVADDTYIQKGFPKQSYAMSKLCINLYTMKVLTQMEEVKKKNIQVYTCCPGWCRTDMAGPKASKSAEEGAETPAYLIDLPWKLNEEYQGKFFYEKNITSL